LTLSNTVLRLATWTSGALLGLGSLYLLLACGRWIVAGTSPAQVIAWYATQLAFVLAGGAAATRLLRFRILPQPPPATAPAANRFLILRLGAWLGGGLAGFLALRLLLAGAEWLRQDWAAPQILARDAIRLTFAVGGAALLDSLVPRLNEPTSTPRRMAKRGRSAVVHLLLAAYGVTWAFGVPAVTTRLVHDDVIAFKKAYANKEIGWWQHYPSIGTSFGVPLLPGIVLVYYESQLGGLWGSGGWHLFAWWATGEHEIASSWRWLS
jgi:hypothetical protein